ncbi:hypothetical protein [Photobacterium gaetbulicola]|uniref:hypothetical protein n=1 Tax=Photobacterium gaetbulicola TaxID=1295392 RepID=UPI001B805C74|nr:hypothetical protein [Photobacterium gaetbulicola]
MAILLNESNSAVALSLTLITAQAIIYGVVADNDLSATKLEADSGIRPGGILAQ